MKTMLGFAFCAGTGAATSAAAVQRSPRSHDILLTKFAPPDAQATHLPLDTTTSYMDFQNYTNFTKQTIRGRPF